MLYHFYDYCIIGGSRSQCEEHDGPRAFPFSALFAPTALTKGLVLLFLQAKPAKTAKLDQKWSAKPASMQGTGSMGKPYHTRFLSKRRMTNKDQQSTTYCREAARHDSQHRYPQPGFAGTVCKAGCTLRYHQRHRRNCPQ